MKMLFRRKYTPAQSAETATLENAVPRHFRMRGKALTSIKTAVANDNRKA